MMEISTDWVALLDEDEDDYLFWQHGFRSWAAHLEIRWFASAHSFLTAVGLGQANPAALMIDGVAPRGEEIKWLSTLLLHPSCEQACLIMLSEEFEDQAHQSYLRLGATDHIIKPANLTELQASVLTVSRHVATRRLKK